MTTTAVSYRVAWSDTDDDMIDQGLRAERFATAAEASRVADWLFDGEPFSTYTIEPTSDPATTTAEEYLTSAGWVDDDPAPRRVRVTYSAAGGLLHRWVQGSGAFTVTVPSDAGDDAVQEIAEHAAWRRAQRNVGNPNARAWDVEWTEITNG